VNHESKEELKKIAELLVKLATTRQTAIKGLVKDSMDLMKENLKAPHCGEASDFTN
jgi:hypothetical protein